MEYMRAIGNVGHRRGLPGTLEAKIEIVHYHSILHAVHTAPLDSIRHIECIPLSLLRALSGCCINIGILNSVSRFVSETRRYIPFIVSSTLRSPWPHATAWVTPIDFNVF